jgi:MinD-like ATPase involved in chromosome partitioning or flagellar assembly
MSTCGKVITFYSYKGGTGRTMALANIAVMLARRNRGRVLIVDWDLEAPGLHSFFPKLAGMSNLDQSQPGVLELFELGRHRSVFP